MSHQDYVSRPRTSKNKKSPYKKNQAPQPQVISRKLKLIGAATLFACIGFGYFLWSIKDIEPDQLTSKPTQSSATEKAKLPEPPKEKWRYMEDLKQKQVEVGEYEVKDKGPWKMQCGSFKTQTQAEKMKATIAFAGLSSKISAVTGSNGTWHKVVLGPFDKKRDAEKNKHKLRSNGISTCQIWLWK